MAGFLERMFETTMQRDSWMHRYACHGLLAYILLKSPNIIRLKVFSKKCESFPSVEVINVISILSATRMDGLVQLDTWKLLGCQDSG